MPNKVYENCSGIEYVFADRDSYGRAVVMANPFRTSAPCWHDQKEAYDRPYEMLREGV
jgi:hypothetical protein